MTTLHGDCREQLQTLPAGSVQCIVTSPPYYGLRKYSDDPREIGQEATPDCLAWARREPPCGACYVCALREVFAQAWRVLRDDGTAWMNLGDSYAGSWGNYGTRDGKQRGERTSTEWTRPAYDGDEGYTGKPGTARVQGLPDKNLIGIPWKVAFALQSDGWFLRSDLIWNKPNCMPESVTDRCTRSHEYVFLLAKSARYYYDAAAIAENITGNTVYRKSGAGPKYAANPHNGDGTASSTLGLAPDSATRNKRTVWTISTQSYSGAHYATMPEALIAPCILAGSAAQACETCGAAWGRVVERTDELDTSAKGSKFDAGKTGVNGQGRVQEGERYVKRDLGFAPRCTCAVNTGSARSVVLDPFGGSGTVARVATRYQRDAVLIELNAEYIADHIETRTDKVQTEMFV